MDAERIAVVGAGNMGAAILRGMVDARWSDVSRLRASHPRAERRAQLEQELGIEVVAGNREAVAGADVVVLAVKPQILSQVLREIREDLGDDALVVSIAAGVSTATIEGLLPEGSRVVRTMPNLAVTVDLGATAMSGGAHATADDLAVVRAIFESVGIVEEVDESLMDAVTGLSGTGPMYVFQIIEGLSDAGVKVGLSRHTSNALAIQTVLGAATMAQVTGRHPGLLKDMVTSPGGTAIAALHQLERGGLRALLIDAVEAATNRSRELGEMVNG